MARQAGEWRDEGQWLNNLGAVHWQTDDYGRALELYNRALHVFQEIHDRYHEGIARTNIGEVHRRLENNNQALVDFQEALGICRAIGDQDGELYVLGYLGLTYTDLTLFDEALAHHQQALKLAHKMEEQSAQANAWYDIGLAYLEKCPATTCSKTDRALLDRDSAALQQSASLHAELDQCDELIADLCALSKAYLALGDLASALVYSARAIEQLGQPPNQAVHAPQACYQHYCALLAHGASTESVYPYLKMAYDSLIRQTESMSDASIRSLVLQNVPIHRTIVNEMSLLDSARS